MLAVQAWPPPGAASADLQAILRLRASRVNRTRRFEHLQHMPRRSAEVDTLHLQSEGQFHWMEAAEACVDGEVHQVELQVRQQALIGSNLLSWHAMMLVMQIDGRFSLPLPAADSLKLQT